MTTEIVKMRYFYNKSLHVVGWSAIILGDCIYVNTRNGHRCWWDTDILEIDRAEYQRCLNSKVPDNKPLYYIPYIKWKPKNNL